MVAVRFDSRFEIESCKRHGVGGAGCEGDILGGDPVAEDPGEESLRLGLGLGLTVPLQ